ncbi:permease [Ahniella affigens]|uniref:Permease n=1 Tax=Ahniella affigens TaxID=2021234 RepID=A0A2P1PPL2_9GAMM|nr:FtsX-like permease family protein [Ahniella affigens]AVP96758.1 permease [Ahniella affigens]
MRVRDLLALGLRQFRRDLNSGEARVLLAALVLAVFSVATVSFITDRAQNALALESNRLLGGDAVLRADTPIPDNLKALGKGLEQAEVWNTMSMLRVGDDMRLSDLRALDGAFPLRGYYRLQTAAGIEPQRRGGPAAGEVWLSRSGVSALGADLGSTLAVGSLNLRVSGIVLEEPDAAMDYFNTAPRAFISIADLNASGLVQPGARINYRWVLAGAASDVRSFTEAVKPQLGRGQRLETASDARPELRTALDRADRFLGLAALISVVLASVAIAMAARQYSERHLDHAAVLRCLGARQAQIASLHGISMSALAALAITIALVAAYGVQALAVMQLEKILGVETPAAGFAPAWFAAAVGLTVLIAFVLPPVLALRRVPALRVLRRDLPATEVSAWVTGGLGLAGLLGLLWWKAQSAALASSLLGGLIVAFLALTLLSASMIWVLGRFRGRLRGAARFGLANISRRATSSMAQVAALGLGLTVLLLLTLVRTDLLGRWQQLIPDNAPNRFIINIQQDQTDALRDFASAEGLGTLQLYPVVRGRLVSVNDTVVTGDSYADRGDRAKRLAEREFNLTALAELAADNNVVAGKVWTAAEADSPQWSVEASFAELLGWKLGDRVRFDLGGQIVEAPITSLRTVKWESFRPNFFVLGSPGTLKNITASYITTARVAPEQTASINALVQRFPNLTVIDVGAILEQVTRIAAQVTEIVEWVFLFTLAAGVLVLVAAIHATQDERLREGSLLRVMGARRGQVRLAQVSEFLVIGLIAGSVAVLAANGIAGSIAKGVFDLDWQPDYSTSGLTLLAAVLLVVAAGWFSTRKTLSAPPSETLRALA